MCAFPAVVLMGMGLCLALSGCGYHLSARPALPGGVDFVSIPVLENDTPENEAGVVMATALSRRAEAEGRLAGRAGGDARLVGRVEFVRASAAAFPSGVRGAGMYALTLRVRLRLMTEPGGALLKEVVVTEREPYLAGRDPEETEAHRRLAFERLCARVADEAWSHLTAPIQD